MLISNVRKFTMYIILSSRPSNNSVTNEVSNIFKYMFFIPIDIATGSIEIFISMIQLVKLYILKI